MKTEQILDKQRLEKLRNDGTLSFLYRQGIISHDVIKKIDIRQKVDELNIAGMKKSDAVKQVAENFGCTVQNIYHHLRR